MTDEQHTEGAPEEIEDLEAPATVQGEIAGGVIECAQPTCPAPETGPGNGTATLVQVYCQKPTCTATGVDCNTYSGMIVVKAR